ncbi:AAA family ATPase [Priestia megaterium]
MKLKNVEIRNFRLLRNLNKDKSVDLNNNTTVLVGKNNSGKTSFSHIFEIFLNENDSKFHFDDFSIDCHSKFEEIFSKYCSLGTTEREHENFYIFTASELPSIELTLTIEYSEKDNWSNIRPLLTSLDESNSLKLVFSYGVEKKKDFFELLKIDYSKKKDTENLIDCIRRIYKNHFSITIKPFSENEQVENVNISDIKKIIGSYFVAAQRQVEDGNSKTSSKLSPIFQKEYQIRQHRDNENIEDTISLGLIAALDNANSDVDEKLSQFFKEFLDSFSTFGYPNVEGADLILKSNVTPSNLFKGIKLFYKNNENLLPEKYNGLGFSNLIYIISEILSFKSKLIMNNTDLNLIFIEEPEAHMHPQLQNTFILKLNSFLEKNNINSQVIITTHSSHIVSNADFESIRYFCREGRESSVKDLMKFKSKLLLEDNNRNTEDENEKLETIKFLKQYITLVKCDMFFADKIILIEGSSERLLMPLFVDKVDEELSKAQNSKVLSEQYISIIEVGGAYMHRFKEFLEFLDVKTLIITDIDSCSKDDRASREITEELIDNLITSNQTLTQWIPQEEKIKSLISIKFDINSSHILNIAYQRLQQDSNEIKCGRSFEEAFIIDNKDYIFDYQTQIVSLKNHLKKYNSSDEVQKNSYKIYEYISKNKKKTDFAFDLLSVNNESWNVPNYIKEGLIWLAK